MDCYYFCPRKHIKREKKSKSDRATHTHTHTHTLVTSLTQTPYQKNEKQEWQTANTGFWVSGIDYRCEWKDEKKKGKRVNVKETLSCERRRGGVGQDKKGDNATYKSKSMPHLFVQAVLFLRFLFLIF